jgi:hypothetical protein
MRTKNEINTIKNSKERISGAYSYSFSKRDKSKI